MAFRKFEIKVISEIIFNEVTTNDLHSQNRFKIKLIEIIDCENKNYLKYKLMNFKIKMIFIILENIKLEINYLSFLMNYQIYF